MWMWIWTLNMDLVSGCGPGLWMWTWSVDVDLVCGCGPGVYVDLVSGLTVLHPPQPAPVEPEILFPATPLAPPPVSHT